MGLTASEARVLGCLIEKELTTPDYYPLTMNALITACNQASNRDPVVVYGEGDVNMAIDALREKQLVRWVKEARSRSAKYRHDVESVPGLSIPERSLLAVLLLRGPQTPGELRTRTDRYHSFSSLNDVEHTLTRLAGREEPITAQLERLPGQKEARWRELWNVERSSTDVESALATPERPPPVDRDLDALKRQVAELTARIDRLERELGVE